MFGWMMLGGRTVLFFLKNGFRKSVASLKHLCRVEVNKSKLLGVDNVLIPGSLREYLNEYPCFITLFLINLDGLSKIFHHYTASRRTAIPCPPPMQAAPMAYFFFCRPNSYAKCPAIREPLIPTGCPIAMAPPF